MHKFLDYIVEAAKPDTTPREINTHLTHLEDLVIDHGYEGAKKAVEYLQSVKDLVSGNGNPVAVLRISILKSDVVFLMEFIIY